MKTLKPILALLVISLMVGACDLLDQQNREFDDDPKLEFKPLSQTVDEGAGTVNVSIQLIGPQRDSDLQVNYSAADTSVAEEGVHYDLSSTSATIPADSSSTEIGIEVLDNSVDDGDTNYPLYLNLQDSDGVEAAENLKTFTLTIRGVDE